MRGWKGERIFEGEEMVVREGWGFEVLEKFSDCDKFLRILVIFSRQFRKFRFDIHVSWCVDELVIIDMLG